MAEQHETTAQVKARHATQRAQPLPAGTKVDIPCWLAKALYQRDIVEVKKPLFLTPKYFNTVKAGAEVCTMRTQSPYLYEVVIKLCEDFPAETASEALKCFINAFITRFTKIILDFASNLR